MSEGEGTVEINQNRVRGLRTSSGGVKVATIDMLLQIAGLKRNYDGSAPSWFHLYAGAGIRVPKQKYLDLLATVTGDSPEIKQKKPSPEQVNINDVLVDRAAINSLFTQRGGLKHKIIDMLMELHGLKRLYNGKFPPWIHLFDGPGVYVSREKWAAIVESSKNQQRKKPDSSLGTMRLF